MFVSGCLCLNVCSMTHLINSIFSCTYAGKLRRSSLSVKRMTNSTTNCELFVLVVVVVIVRCCCYCMLLLLYVVVVVSRCCCLLLLMAGCGRRTSSSRGPEI